MKDPDVRSKSRLGRAILNNCIVFALLISLSAWLIGFAMYYVNKIADYQSYIQTLLDLSEREFDGDDLKQCIETGTKSEEFERAQQFLNDTKKQQQY